MKKLEYERNRPKTRNDFISRGGKRIMNNGIDIVKTPFQMFQEVHSDAVRVSLRDSGNDAGVSHVQKIVQEKWSVLSEEEQQPYVEMHKAEKLALEDAYSAIDPRLRGTLPFKTPLQHFTYQQSHKVRAELRQSSKYGKEPSGRGDQGHKKPVGRAYPTTKRYLI